MDQVIEQTRTLYQELIKGTIAVMKSKSEAGELQMSESEIEQFRDAWECHFKGLPWRELKEVKEPEIIKKVKVQQEEPANDFEIKLELKEDDYDISFESIVPLQEKKQQPDIKIPDKNRPKTLFDRIREIARLQKEWEDEHSDIDEKIPGISVYTQKMNIDNQALTRIKPNKIQRTLLQTVLISLSDADALYANGNLTFNFKNKLK